MRIVAPIAAVLLVAGCSPASDEQARPSERMSSIPPNTSSVSPKTPTSSAVAKTPPAAGAPIATVAAWIAAGTPADPGGFHSATRDGATTQLDDGFAFTTPSGKATCMVGLASFDDGQLACLADLTDPPAQPPDAVGQWIGGWIAFPGDTLTVGGLHGDPGQFGYGKGAALSDGQSLKFGDYQCRVDKAGLFCINFAHQTAARISDVGIAPFGCLREVEPPADVGAKFSC